MELGVDKYPLPFCFCTSLLCGGEEGVLCVEGE